MAETAVLEYVDVSEQVLLAPELTRDKYIRRDAQRFIGACLTRETVDLSFAEPAEQVRPIESLHDALQLAYEGDDRAKSMVETNVRTDVIERTIKAGHIIEVALDVDEAGRIQQFGQSMESVHANSLRHASDNASMLARTSAEATNAFRIAELFQTGTLEDYNFVVFSRAADDMDEPAMQQAGFFTDTMSMAIQVTSAHAHTVVTESAFVAGRPNATMGRRDDVAVAKVGARLGVDISGLSATELLAMPLLVPKSVMPNGVVDLVRLYDEALADGSFFGLQQAPESYYNFKDRCKQREQQYAPIIAKVTNQLIDQAPHITSRLEACQLLSQLSQDAMVEQASIGDATIDPRVFGPAEADVIAARQAWQAGNVELALQHAINAKRNAVSSSCPTALKSSALSSENGSQNDSKEVGDCEFVSRECPKCHKKNVLTKVSKGKISGSCGCSAKLT